MLLFLEYMEKWENMPFCTGVFSMEGWDNQKEKVSMGYFNEDMQRFKKKYITQCIYCYAHILETAHYDIWLQYISIIIYCVF